MMKLLKGIALHADRAASNTGPCGVSSKGSAEVAMTLAEALLCMRKAFKP